VEVDHKYAYKFCTTNFLKIVIHKIMALVRKFEIISDKMNTGGICRSTLRLVQKFYNNFIIIDLQFLSLSYIE
jgi:hypothetical protein